MSDLYRSAIGARLAKLPHLPALASSEDDVQDEDEIADSISSLPGSGMGPPAMPARSARTRKSPNVTFAPISASAFFAEAAQSSVPASQLDFRIYYTPPKATDGTGTVMVCHHGAGTSGLSFACFAKEVSDMTKEECGVLALDARRHGLSVRNSPCFMTDFRHRKNDINIYHRRLRPINLRSNIGPLRPSSNTLP
jgi:protein phosphatase methylesterase 1